MGGHNVVVLLIRLGHEPRSGEREREREREKTHHYGNQYQPVDDELMKFPSFSFILLPSCLVQVWKQLDITVKEITIGGVRCYHMIPESPRNDYLLLHTHGGGYIVNGGPAATIEAAWVANATKFPILSIDYRMPPQYPSPAALNDVIAVWDEVVVKQSLVPISLSRVGLFGGSAGGGLAMAATMKLVEQGKPVPSALLLNSPWADISKTGDSYVINEMVDNLLVSYDATLEQAANLYADGKDLKDPYLSPVYGDLSGFPPTQIVSGTRDLLLSCAVRVHRKLRRAGIDAELHVFEGLSHNEWQPMFDIVSIAKNLPLEMQEALEETTRFFSKHLGNPGSKSSCVHMSVGDSGMR